MARKRAVSLLKRGPGTPGSHKSSNSKSGPSKATQLKAQGDAVGKRPHKPRQIRPVPPPGPKAWTPASVVHRQAAWAIQRLLAADASGKGGASLKTLTLAPHIEAKRATHAVTCECLRHLVILRELAESTGILAKFPRLSAPVAYVLMYDTLFGQPPRPIGAPERAILTSKVSSWARHFFGLILACDWEVLAWVLDNTEIEARRDPCRACCGRARGRSLSVREMMHGDARPPHQSKTLPLQQEQMEAALASSLSAAGVGSVEELLAARAPPGGTAAACTPHARCVRVNTLRTSVEEALAELRGCGHCQVELDPLLPSVLSLPPGTDLHALPGVSAGRLVLQSRASCMPAAVLRPPPGAALLDACAAPGNKTTQLAALLGLGRGGSVLALDRDPQRVQRLQASVDRAGAAGVVTVRCADFLGLDPLRHAHVEGILLDPSCSGSGTAAARADAFLPGAAARQAQGEASPRVEALAAFQETALRHALRFPGLQRLTYSTCSVHVRENEAVVAAVLPDAEAAGMELAAALPGWHRRGIEGTCPGAVRLVRTGRGGVQGALS